MSELMELKERLIKIKQFCLHLGSKELKKLVLVLFFLIFLVNTASAGKVALTVTQGDELSRSLIWTGQYESAFGSVEASGSAASWVTPRSIDFGVVDPGETSERDYIIKVPKNQEPGYYEITWKWSCRYISGKTCSFTDPYTVFQITVKATPAPTAAKDKYMPLTLTPGEEQNENLEFSAPYGSLYAWADASGDAASWVTPRHIDFGVVDKGKSNSRYYTIKVPENQYPGYYEIIWKSGCKYVSGETCSVAGETVIQITVEATKPMPTFTRARPGFTPTPESSTDPGLLGLLGLSFILILFFWYYIVVWVAKDANKRGTSGTLWGILAFFLGLIGLLIYLIVRPKGTIVLCEHCGKEKLETLTQCPHCKKTPTPAFKPTPAAMPAPYPATKKPQEARAEPSANELKELKEKLSKTNQLLDKLDERLAQGELTEAKYKELSEKYRAEADKLKNLIAEKELLDEVGLKDD